MVATTAVNDFRSEGRPRVDADVQAHVRLSVRHPCGVILGDEVVEISWARAKSIY